MYTPEELKTFEELFKGKVIINESMEETIEKRKKFISFLHHKIKVQTKFLENLETFCQKRNLIF